MAQFYEALTRELREFIEAQPVFFTATAPNSGRINVSPKGMDTFRILDDRTVAYLDLTGSGNETSAHLRENGRITVMFCSFGKTPMIVRLHGHGRVIRSNDAEWNELHGRFPLLAGERQIMKIAIDSAMTSCGWNVPRMELLERRDGVPRYWEKKGQEQVVECWRDYNAKSIDGLPTGIMDGVEVDANGDTAGAAADARNAMAVHAAKPSAR
jgi:hypothetical protein